jgi:hypothetical protein
MVGFHPLQGMDEHSPPLEVIRLLLRGDGALHRASGPECMAHGTPRIVRICPKIRGPVVPNNKPRGDASKGQVHQTIVIDSRLDGVRGPLLVKGQSQIVGTE